MLRKYLIVGLGNPGKAYERTRHNVGFRALDLFAEKHRLAFQKKTKLKGSLAEGIIHGEAAVLLKPETYMNLSGESLALVVKYKEIDLSRVLVLVDDVAIAFGELRMRINSGSGGHNGLKSIEEKLQTNRYSRLRIGVGDPKNRNLEDYVLSKFLEEEEKILPEILERSCRAIEIWLDKGITRAMDFANKRPSNPSNGEKNE